MDLFVNEIGKQNVDENYDGHLLAINNALRPVKFLKLLDFFAKNCSG